MTPDEPSTDAGYTPYGRQARMPVLFVGHGSPMNAIEDNEFSRAWCEVGRHLPKPKAVLCISAHWETVGTRVTAMERPRTIHDFSGFPRSLYQVQYPAPGAPDLARLIQETLPPASVLPDYDWGLDHGTWSVLCRLLPAADVPVIQLSLDRASKPDAHYRLGQALRPLREQGVLILGSGNVVHNLGVLTWQDAALDWALRFDETVRRLIMLQDHRSLAHYQELGADAQLSIPTNEHFLPLLYTLALQERDDEVQFFADRVALGSISMRSLRIG